MAKRLEISLIESLELLGKMLGNSIKKYFIVIWLSFKWIFKTNVGDRVWFEGKKYLVTNGVRQGAWRLNKLINEDQGWVGRRECSKVISPINLINSFRSGYRFYMQNWYGI